MIFPVEPTDIKGLQEWLKKEEPELLEALNNFEKLTPEEQSKLWKRNLNFTNLWNYDNIMNKKEHYYACIMVNGAVPPNRCMMCNFGHMAFDCHYPFDCNSEYCHHYDHLKDENGDIVE
jgi:hypothetical protein